MDATGVADLSGRLVDELSGGQRQRVWVAMVLAQETPTAAAGRADHVPRHRPPDRAAWSCAPTCTEQGRTLVAVLHDLNQAARYATHLIAMRDGAVVAEGPPAEIVTAELVEEVFGLPCLVVPDPVTGTPSVTPIGRARDRRERGSAR